MKSNKNILLIGLGSIAKKHIAALHGIDSSICIYALRSNANAPSIPGVVNVYKLEELEKIELDFAIISSPTFKHIENVQSLLNLQIPLFIEKPLANKKFPPSLLNEIEEKNIQTYVACNLRFLDCLNFVQDYLKQNSELKVNEVNAYCGSFLPDWRPGVDFKKTYSANEDQGGGVHLDLIHEIDYVYWLFGCPDEVNKLLRSNSNLDIQAHDFAHYNLIYPGFVASITLNYYRKEAKRDFEIVFDKHTIRVDLLKNEVYRGQELIFSSEQKIIDTYELQMKYFIEHLNKENFNDICEAVEVLNICLKN